MRNFKRDVKRIVRESGACLRNERFRGHPSGEITIEAPDGMVFPGTAFHEVVIQYFIEEEDDGWCKAWMDCKDGFEPCPQGAACDWCN
jgi:hypothetical protein